MALGQVVDLLGATVIAGESSGREQLSLAIALVVVGAPVFAIHWWLINRGWGGVDAAAADDRRSAIRAFHMALVASVSIAAAMSALQLLIEPAFGAILGVDRADASWADGHVVDEPRCIPDRGADLVAAHDPPKCRPASRSSRTVPAPG